MTDPDPHDRLVELQDRLVRLAAELELLCAAPVPDRGALGGTRWRIAEASRHRMELLTATIFPLLQRRCTAQECHAVDALREATIAYRRQISEYVARWPSAAILEEWKTYQGEARLLREQISARIGRERLVLLPLLRRARTADPARVAC